MCKHTARRPLSPHRLWRSCRQPCPLPRRGPCSPRWPGRDAQAPCWGPEPPASRGACPFSTPHLCSRRSHLESHQLDPMSLLLHFSSLSILHPGRLTGSTLLIRVSLHFYFISTTVIFLYSTCSSVSVGLPKGRGAAVRGEPACSSRRTAGSRATGGGWRALSTPVTWLSGVCSKTLVSTPVIRPARMFGYVCTYLEMHRGVRLKGVLHKNHATSNNLRLTMLLRFILMALNLMRFLKCFMKFHHCTDPFSR